MIRINVALVFLLALCSPTSAAEEKTNVLFFAIDDLRNCVGAFGDKLAITPNIDKLAMQGTVFRNAHCQSPICNPSRASVMTGLRPDTTRVWGLSTHFRQQKPNVVTLPQLFKNNGYYTHSIGKIYHGIGKASVDPPSWSDAPELDHVTKRDAYVLKKNRTGKKAAASEMADCADNDHIDGKVADLAIEKLRELKKSGKPFFLAVGFRKPHMPFNAPKKYWKMHDRSKLERPRYPDFPADAPSIASHGWPEARGYTDIPNKGPIPPEKIAETRHGYYAATSFMDAQLGKVINELETLGLAGNTVIVLYGDHGFHIGELDIWGKLTNYEVSTNAPMLIVSPKQKTKGSTVDKAVEFLDIYPTVADLCGLKKPKELEGTSLVKVLDDPFAEVKDFAISQIPRPVSYNFTKKPPVNMGYSIRNQRFRYTKWVNFKTGATVAEEFYDYEVNKLERSNQIGNAEHATIIHRMKEQLKKETAK